MLFSVLLGWYIVALSIVETNVEFTGVKENDRRRRNIVVRLAVVESVAGRRDYV